MYSAPTRSPWGSIIGYHEIIDGVFHITTESFSSAVMVHKDASDILSLAAKRRGISTGDHLCFAEHDCLRGVQYDDNTACIVYRELLDKIPDLLPHWLTNDEDKAITKGNVKPLS